MQWLDVLESEKLTVDQPKIIRHGPKQICLWRNSEGLFAFDNRCPHEGYPLKEGKIDGRCVLTCFWHNWKFNLADGGRNLHERDRLRTYPIKEEDGRIWIDVANPEPEAMSAMLLEGIKGAFNERQFGRLARGLSRFQHEGLPVDDVIRAAVEWTHDKLEFGTTHAFAVAPDWLQLAAETDDADRRLTYLTEVLDHMAYDVLRRPVFPFTTRVADYDAWALNAAIESEDEAEAVAMMNGAEAAGMTLDDLVPDLAPIVLQHYRGFGHPLIYLTKAMELTAHLGESITYPILRPWIRYLCLATREDLLPEFRNFEPSLEALSDVALVREHDERLDMPFGLSVNQALSWTVESLGKFTPESVYRALLQANARNMLHFDLDYGVATDLPVARNFGWLDMTHGLTMANALRKLAQQDPGLWKPGLLQIACFVGRAKSFLHDEPQDGPWAVDDFDAFWAKVTAALADHGYDHPIYPSHHVKTSLAVREELPGLDVEGRQTVLAALNRFLHTPIKTKHGLRLAKQARDLVARDYA